MKEGSDRRERLLFLADVVAREADNLNRAERLGWLRSASDWAELRPLRNRMVHEYVREPQERVEALHAAHRGVADLNAAATAMAERAKGLAQSRAH